MRYWKFSQKTKLKQKLFADSEKEVGNFFQDWDHSGMNKDKSLVFPGQERNYFSRRINALVL